jgi:hypothetical protein
MEPLSAADQRTAAEPAVNAAALPARVRQAGVGGLNRQCRGAVQLPRNGVNADDVPDLPGIGRPPAAIAGNAGLA